MTTLNAKAWLSLAAVVVVMGLLLFSAAGTVRYWQGWAYLAIVASTSAVASVYLMRHGPALLARRMRAGPTAETQLDRFRRPPGRISSRCPFRVVRRAPRLRVSAGGPGAAKSTG